MLKADRYFGLTLVWLLFCASNSNAQLSTVEEFAPDNGILRPEDSSHFQTSENEIDSSIAQSVGTYRPGLKGFLKDRFGIESNGMLWHTLNTNSRNPTNPPGGFGSVPGGLFLYRADEYMFNWLGMSFNKAAEARESEWDFGGGAHFVYGTDYFTLQSRGLEQEPDGTNRWNSDSGSGLIGGLHGLAIPELYGEAAYDRWRFTFGKFFHPLGFSRYVPNANNIANTRSYTQIFGEFATVTGLQTRFNITPQLALVGAFHRGDANWVDNNNKLSSYYGFDWQSENENTELRFIFDIGREDDAGVNDQYVHAIVFQQRFLEKWLYLAHHNLGWIENGAGSGRSQNWYSLEQQVACEFSAKLVGGIRYEFFVDQQGVTVGPTPGPGTYHLLDCGGTYRMTEQIWFRPELRWEWFEADAGVIAPGPFGNGQHRSQFVGSMSMFVFF